MATTWPAFDVERRDRIAEQHRRGLRAQKRDESQAEGIIASLEKAVLWYVPQPGAPGFVYGPDLPREVGEAANELHKALSDALTNCDDKTRFWRMELLRHVIGGRYESWPDIFRADATLAWRKVFASDWIDALERLAEPPQKRGQPRLTERDDGFRRHVAWVVREAGMPCPGRGVSHTEMVFAEVLAYGFKHGLKQGPSTVPEQRTARRDALKRALGVKDQDPILEKRRAEETELLRQSWRCEAAETVGDPKRSK